ncbi:hypothetical protein [uncultured Tateyamaria sp.]|uniref:hypothetical protein n=1 Tax=Tateyamaria sp. TaxID=1929288 RepID=UPI0026354D99|nr:hypothetical protein [uncultured Tateyamaria sp.]
MTISRNIGHAPRTRALAEELNALNGPCIGCTGCEGVCQALLDALVVPDVVTKAVRR